MVVICIGALKKDQCSDSNQWMASRKRDMESFFASYPNVSFPTSCLTLVRDWV